jgi:hypothetical protein
MKKLYADQQMTEQELFEMANFWGSDLGLDDNIVLWIGSCLSSKYGNRIKVSNITGKVPGSSRDTFNITIPKLEVIGQVNTKHITTKKLNKIFDFIKLNMELIIAFCQEEIDTIEFVQKVKKLE